MSQYHSINVGETERFFTVVARASGDPITTGTVNYYLKAKSGANAGKWWKDLDQTWDIAETANAMTHDADGHWEIDLTSTPFADGVRYLEYAKESGDLHVPQARHLVGTSTGFLLQLEDTGATAVARTGADSDTLETLSDQIDAVGTGARTVAITVNDGTTALESTRVRVTKGAESYLLSTDIAGLATFNLDDGTWIVAITLAGYTYSGTTLAVAANVTQTYSMTAAGFTPSTEPDSVTIQWLVINAHDYAPIGAGEGTITIRIKEGPGTDGYAWGKNERSATTNANGMIEFANVPLGATIRARLGAAGSSGEWFDLTIPADATSPYDAGEIIGDASDDGT